MQQLVAAITLDLGQAAAAGGLAWPQQAYSLPAGPEEVSAAFGHQRIPALPVTLFPDLCLLHVPLCSGKRTGVIYRVIARVFNHVPAIAAAAVGAADPATVSCGPVPVLQKQH